MKAPKSWLTVADQLEATAKLLRVEGKRAAELASLLSARGWPAGTLGSGSRSSDTTSSTERAAGFDGRDGSDGRTATPLNAGPWVGADEDLTRFRDLAWQSAFGLQERIHSVLVHAQDDDPLPAGTGECEACGVFCRPTKDRPEFRIKSGLCPACYQSCHRSPLDRVEWIRLRRRGLVEAEPVEVERVAEVCAGCLVDEAPKPELGDCPHGHDCCSVVAPHEHFHEPEACPECHRVESRAAS